MTTRLLLRRMGLPALLFVAWAGCFNSLEFENIVCSPQDSTSCPKNYRCLTQGTQSVCRKGVEDAAVPASGDGPIDHDGLSDDDADGSRDAVRDVNPRDFASETSGADGRRMDAGEDHPTTWPHDGGLDTPVDAGGLLDTGGMVEDVPSGTGGASGSGGTTGTGGKTGDAGTSVDAPVSGGEVSQGGSGTGGVTGGTGSGGITGTGGIGGIGGVSTMGGSSSTDLGGAGGTSTGGVSATGGLSSFGGASTGGTTETGGSTATGGASSGGVSATGGTGTGGATGGSGGTTGGLVVRLDLTKQTIEGFGINDTWSQLTNEQAQHLFDAQNGLGLTILRVGMAPEGGFYNGTDEVTAIASARAHGATKIIGTAWSPPGSFKDNGSVTEGGHLYPQHYEAWASRLAKFATDNGLYAMSPQSDSDFASCGSAEPCNGDYDSTVYTAAEMVEFIKVLGQKLQAANIKLIAPEPSQWLRLWKNGSACCSVPSGLTSPDALAGQYDYGHALYRDSTAWGLIDIIGTHQYYSQTAEPWPSDVPQTKPLWMTEMSGIRWWPEGAPSDTLENGLAVAGWIHDALVNGDASAWLWWWYKALDQSNQGLLLMNGTDTKRHYVLGQFSKFIRPGYTRVSITGVIPPGVLLSAYKGGNGTVVIVAINKGDTTESLPLSINGGTAPASLVPWVTAAQGELIPNTAVAVSAGSFTAVLAAKSVTTFVGQ